MSDSHSHNAPHGDGSGAHTGSDEMNLLRIVIVGVVSLALFAVGIVWAYRIMVGYMAELQAKGAAKDPSEIGKSEIGIVDQVLFSTDHRLEDWKAENAKRLTSYGWIDRTKGIAHIPIEKAMEQVVASPPDIAGEGVPPVAKMPAPAATGSAAPKPGAKP